MTSTYYTYYIETNLICWMFIAFVLFTYIRESRGLTESKWFISVLLAVQVYCLADIFAAVFKNQTFSGARTILWIANDIYITLPLILVIFWNQYIREHIRAYYKAGNRIRRLDNFMIAVAIAALLISLSTPFTHSTFYLDEMNGYHRTAGAYAVPMFAYAFMIYETLKLQYIKRHSASLQVKEDTQILSVFAVPCIFFSLVQVCVYGTTVSQVGFTMALMIIYLARQRNNISKDELTGLNNRREYEYAIDRMAKSSGNALILMADVDNFKSINDTYGHIEGDQALKAISMILKDACANRKHLGNIALYRYGGDEFIMVSTESNIEQTKDLLIESIKEETDKWNNHFGKVYKLSMSIGVACGYYNGYEIYQMIEKADQEMYTNKASKKK